MEKTPSTESSLSSYYFLLRSHINDIIDIAGGYDEFRVEKIVEFMDKGDKETAIKILHQEKLTLKRRFSWFPDKFKETIKAELDFCKLLGITPPTPPAKVKEYFPEYFSGDLLDYFSPFDADPKKA